MGGGKRIQRARTEQSESRLDEVAGDPHRSSFLCFHAGMEFPRAHSNPALKMKLR